MISVKWTKIKVDLETMTAKIEAGASLGQVYNTLWEYGTTIPAGTESSVGLAGLTLGGGIGMLTRLFGLTCDNLLEIEMVRACGYRDAELIKANKHLNSDLILGLPRRRKLWHCYILYIQDSPYLDGIHLLRYMGVGGFRSRL
ncbi:hypothetical protein GCM10020331_074190 [Ectobacillus funiculus]